MSVRLTSYSHGAGCACKLGPTDLADVMAGLQLPPASAEMLVDASTSDDAAVYLPAGATAAVIATTDFFTPIVDDAFDWGRIAATNAVSDIYAMGGRPAFALNLVAWPIDDLPAELLGRVLAGGAQVASDAGFAIAGGHSITDPEPKYGMAAVGFAAPEQIVRNSTGHVGDHLFLTKPLGLGMISTAIKRGDPSDEQVETAIATMTTLNLAAAEAMREAPVSAATDVTGFGLLGHLHEMALASGVAAEVDAAAVPLLPGVVSLARGGMVAGGTRRNHDFVVSFSDLGDLSAPEQLILADAQTSGGLLIATPDPDAMAEALAGRGVQAALVGRLTDGPAGSIRVAGRVRDDTA